MTDMWALKLPETLSVNSPSPLLISDGTALSLSGMANVTQFGTSLVHNPMTSLGLYTCTDNSVLVLVPSNGTDI